MKNKNKIFIVVHKSRVIDNVNGRTQEREREREIV